MISKNELLEKLIGINCSVNATEKGIQIFVKDKPEKNDKKITEVGKDLFVVTKIYGEKPQKIYYSIDSIVVIEGFVIEAGL